MSGWRGLVALASVLVAMVLAWALLRPAAPPDAGGGAPAESGGGAPVVPLPGPPLPDPAPAAPPDPLPAPRPAPAYAVGGDRPYFAHARFAPARDTDGQPLGLQVESVLAGGKVARLGLRAGDLMLAINGERLDDPRTFPRAVARAEEIFRTETMITVKLRRGEEVFSLAAVGAIRTEPVEQ